MPLYQNNPFQRPKLLHKGVAVYLLGSLNQLQGNSQFAITNVAIAANVATITTLLVNGPAPNVGDLISITGTTTGAGEFNVNRVPLTAVTVNLDGTGSLVFALTGANVSAADSGTAIVEPAEVAETLTNSTNSIACAVQAPDGDSQFTVPFAVTCPSIPTAATFTLQTAIKNLNAEFTNTSAVITIAASAFTAGPVVQATLQRGYVYRIAVTGVSGGISPNVIGKLG